MGAISSRPGPTPGTHTHWPHLSAVLVMQPDGLGKIYPCKEIIPSHAHLGFLPPFLLVPFLLFFFFLILSSIFVSVSAVGNFLGTWLPRQALSMHVSGICHPSWCLYSPWSLVRSRGTRLDEITDRLHIQPLLGIAQDLGESLLTALHQRYARPVD